MTLSHNDCIPPDQCRPREYDYDQDSLGKHLDQRFAPTTGEKLGGPTGHGPGRLCVWTKPPDGVQNSASSKFASKSCSTDRFDAKERS